MKITELLGLPDLDKLSDQELELHLMQFFPKTRPKDAKITVEDIFASSDVVKLARAQMKKQQQSVGLDLSDL